MSRRRGIGARAEARSSELPPSAFVTAEGIAVRAATQDDLDVVVWRNNFLEEHYGDELSYTLEVTSPGADQPLRDPRQYVRHVGRTLHVKLKDGTEKTGKLESILPEGIELAEILKEKHKEKILPAITVPFQDITEAVVVISFK